MCHGITVDPLVRAMPFFVSGAIVLAISILLQLLLITKKGSPRYLKILRTILALSSIVVLLFGWNEFNIRYLC